MPRYQITAPDGRTVTVEGDAPPTEADAETIFASLAPASVPDPLAGLTGRERVQARRDEQAAPALAQGFSPVAYDADRFTEAFGFALPTTPLASMIQPSGTGGLYGARLNEQAPFEVFIDAPDGIRKALPGEVLSYAEQANAPRVSGEGAFVRQFGRDLPAVTAGAAAAGRASQATEGLRQSPLLPMRAAGVALPIVAGIGTTLGAGALQQLGIGAVSEGDGRAAELARAYLESQQADIEQQPTATMLGGIAASIPTAGVGFNPGMGTVQRITSSGVGAGLAGGGQALQEIQNPDDEGALARVLTAATAGAIQQRDTNFARALGGGARAPVAPTPSAPKGEAANQAAQAANAIKESKGANAQATLTQLSTGGYPLPGNMRRPTATPEVTAPPLRDIVGEEMGLIRPTPEAVEADLKAAAKKMGLDRGEAARVASEAADKQLPPRRLRDILSAEEAAAQEAEKLALARRKADADTRAATEREVDAAGRAERAQVQAAIKEQVDAIRAITGDTQDAIYKRVRAQRKQGTPEELLQVLNAEREYLLNPMSNPQRRIDELRPQVEALEAQQASQRDAFALADEIEAQRQVAARARPGDVDAEIQRVLDEEASLAAARPEVQNTIGLNATRDYADRLRRAIGVLDQQGLSRSAARALAMAGTPDEYSFILNQLRARAGVTTPASRPATTRLTSLEDLNPDDIRLVAPRLTESQGLAGLGETVEGFAGATPFDIAVSDASARRLDANEIIEGNMANPTPPVDRRAKIAELARARGMTRRTPSSPLPEPIPAQPLPDIAPATETPAISTETPSLPASKPAPSIKDRDRLRFLDNKFARGTISAAEDAERVRLMQGGSGERGAVSFAALSNVAAPAAGAAVGAALGETPEERLTYAGAGALAAAGFGYGLRAIFNRAPKVPGAPGTSKPKRGLGTAAKDLGEKYLGLISTRIRNISPELHAALIRYELRTRTIGNNYRAQLKPFFEELKGLSAQDKVDVDIAVKNGDADAARAIFSKYGEEKAARLNEGLDNAYRTFSEVGDAAEQVGYEFGRLGNYWPRKVKDYDGFLEYVGANKKGPILDAIRAAEVKEGRPLTPEERTDIANATIRGARTRGIDWRPASMKSRTVDEVTRELNQFYAPMEESAIGHIDRLIPNIEQRVLLGRMDGNIEDSIGAVAARMVDEGKITAAQERELTDILTARFKAEGLRANPLIAAAKSAGYISTLGNPISALTQIGDLFFAAYKNGYYKAGKALLGKREISLEDLGIERIAQEFDRDPGALGKALEKTFKYSGFNKIDELGKETLINSGLRRLRKDARSEPGSKDFSYLERTWRPVFGDEFDSFVSDLRAGRNTENVKLALFMQLSDMQPISLSEMPVGYLENPNGRIMYALKTFMLKQWDILRRDAFGEMARGNVGTGVKNLMAYTLAVTLAGLSGDALKDFILGRETDMNDKVASNLLRLAGLSKYTFFRAKREGPGTAAVELVTPPTVSIANDAFKDLLDPKVHEDPDMARSVKNIPMVGRFLYWYFGRGAKQEEEAEMKRRLGESP